MRRVVAVRLLHAVVVLFLVATAAFFLIHAAPGDPFSFENDRIPAEIRDAWRRRYGYDRPLVEQYGRYLVSVARGDFGYSHSLHVPVREAIAERLPRTVLLMGLSLVLSFGIAIRLGVYEVRHRRERRARVANGASLLMYSVPDFWLALVLLLTFAYWLPVLPAGQMVDTLHDYMTPGRAVWDRVRHLVLPLAALTLQLTAMLVRYQRSALLEVLPADYVRTARAKGTDERAVIGRHALRNALLPMITLAGVALPALVGGAVFVERVFSWPGMGLMAVNAIFLRDYPLVIASALVGAAVVVVGSLLADIAYALADPRVRVR
ncbi:MAG TPA: ABC transporter permease [Gemmatimonadaceae bacterium]|nr:ABC transporter permease [Gemmatimonadaceae bacterium]